MIRELTHKGFAVKKPTGTGIKSYLWIPCPFHQETIASFEIRTDGKWCKCFGCGWKGDWDKLAAAIGMAPVFGDENRAQFEYEISDMVRYLDDILKKDEEVALVDLPLGVEPWGRPYRGISLPTLRSVPTYKWFDEKFETQRILWPVFVQEELNGWVSRRLDKKDVARYYNMPDTANEEWVSSSLFLLDHIDSDVVAVVEGPVDALYLMEHGIPAVAYLGGGWSYRKTVLLAAQGLSRIIIIPDNDENKAGDHKAIKVYNSLKMFFDTQVVRLPRKFGDAAELDDRTLGKLGRLF